MSGKRFGAFSKAHLASFSPEGVARLFALCVRVVNQSQVDVARLYFQNCLGSMNSEKRCPIGIDPASTTDLIDFQKTVAQSVYAVS